MPTELSELMRKLNHVDLVGIAEQMQSIMTKVDGALQEFDYAAINSGIQTTLGSVNDLVKIPEFKQLLESIRQTSDEIRSLAANFNSRVDPLSQQAEQALKQFDATLLQVQQGMGDLRDMLAPRAELRHELDLVLKEVAEAARSIGQLADYLNRNPRALLTGKQLPEKLP